MDKIYIEKHMRLLGLKVKDRVTGFSGIVTSIAFDLYGCIQALVNAGMNKDGKLGDNTVWFDTNRLVISDGKPVMEVPDFEYGAVAEGRKGPEAKPRSAKP